MAEEEVNEGLSTPKKVVAGAAVGVAIPAAVGVAKKLIGDSSEDGEDGDQSQQPDDRQRRRPRGATSRRPSGSGGSRSSGGSKSGSRASTSAKSKPKPKSRRSSSSSRSSSGTTSGGRQRTKEQLYATAKRLNIEGRSQMTKAQLERAVARARS
jgi:hypothetical protein